MKRLLVLRGLHYKYHNFGPKNWKLCYQSLYDNYIKFFNRTEIDIYFQTYISTDFQELITYYNPIKYIAYPDKKFDKYNQTKNIYNILELINNIEQYDEILITRFDILYKMPYSKWNIDLNYLNIPFQHPKKGINDCIYIMSGTQSKIFIDSIKDLDSKNLHRINFKNIRFMFKEKFYSDTDYSKYLPLNNNPLYILYRIRRCKPSKKVQKIINSK